MPYSQSNLPVPSDQGGGSPFDEHCHLDAYGRQYWLAREMQALMAYPRWQPFEAVIDRAMAAARNVGDAAAVFTVERKNAGQHGGRPLTDYRLSRAAAYYVAMNGDPSKSEVAAAQAYFVWSTREAEHGRITQADKDRTALARAREMVDYQIFRDMMRDNAPDYDPGSRKTSMFFATTQNALYRHLTGMTAEEIKSARQLQTWDGCEDGKGEPGPKSKCRKVAKNYLTASELRKLDRLVGMLCLRAEMIAEDGGRLSLEQWQQLVNEELKLGAAVRCPLAA